MDEAYHKKTRAHARFPEGDPPAGLAVRRNGDRCFHAVEEVVKEGFIVEGILFSHDDVAEVRGAGEDVACRVPVTKMVTRPRAGGEKTP